MDASKSRILAIIVEAGEANYSRYIINIRFVRLQQQGNRYIMDIISSRTAAPKPGSKKASNIQRVDSNRYNRKITDFNSRRETHNSRDVNNSRDANNNSSISRDVDSNRDARNSMDANKS